MKHIFLLFFLLAVNAVHGQVRVYAQPGGNQFGPLDLQEKGDNECEVEFSPTAHPFFTADIEFGPDGQLYLLTVVLKDTMTEPGRTIKIQTGVMVAEYDFRNDLYRDTIFQTGNFAPGNFALGNGVDEQTITTTFDDYRFDFVNVNDKSSQEFSNPFVRALLSLTLLLF